MKPYYHLANKNTQAKDNSTEGLQADSNDAEEPLPYSESESVHSILPGGNHAFLVSPLSDTKLSKENKVRKECMHVHVYIGSYTS